MATGVIAPVADENGPPRADGEPRVSVVVAAFNAEKYVGETISSVLSQSLRTLELIVVDDGSTDRTAEIVEAAGDSRVRLITMPNRGVSAARNAGLASVRSPYVLFLDADDILTPRALEAMMGALDAQPAKVACCAHHEKVDEAGAAFAGGAPSRLKTIPAGETLRQLLAKNFVVNGGALCIRSEVARAVGGFSPSLRLGEDWEFWCRLAMVGDFEPLPDLVAVRYRQLASGANSKLRGGPLRLNEAAVEAVFANPRLQTMIGLSELTALRRRARMDLFWSSARMALAGRRYVRFIAFVVVGLMRFPSSVMHPTLIYLFVRSSLAAVRSSRPVRP